MYSPVGNNVRVKSDAGGKVLPPFEGQVTLVVKGGGGWQIEAWRYTQKPASAPQDRQRPHLSLGRLLRDLRVGMPMYDPPTP